MSPLENKAAFQALAGIAENNPLIRAAIKYWWLAIPAGIVMYYKVSRAPSKDLETILTSFGVSFGPVIPLIMLSESLAKSSAQVATAVPAAQVKDAQFQVVPPSITPAPQPFPAS